MRLNGSLVGLGADDYRQQVHNICADRDIWRSLVALDINGFRNATRARAPYLPQPESDWQALYIMHLARVRMLHLSPQQKRYSEHWLREMAPKTRIAAAVGIAVRARNAGSVERAAQVQAAMSEAVLEAVKAGVDIETEVVEVHRRMKLARQKIVG